MPKKQRNELTAGVFVLVALAAGVGVLLWLGATDLLAKPTQRAAFFANEDTGSYGLAEGSFVQVNDAVVGKIAEIRYQPDKQRTLYIAEIDRHDVKIHADAESAVTFGLVGAKTLVVTARGSADQPLADEACPARISGGPAQRALNDLASAAKIIRQQLDPKEKEMLLAKILAVVGSLQEQTDLDDSKSLLAMLRASAGNLKQTTAAARRATDPADPESTLSKVDDSVDDIKVAAANAAGMVKTIRPDLEKTAATIRRYADKDVAELLVQLRNANTKLVETVGNLRDISADGRELMVLNRHRLEDTVLHLKVMSANLSAAAKEIRRNPWRLLHRPGEKETQDQTLYDTVRAFGEGAGQLRDAVTRLEALSKAQGEITTADPALKKVLTSLQKSFEKFGSVERKLWEQLTARPGKLPAGGSGE